MARTGGGQCDANVKRAPGGMTEMPCKLGGFCNDVVMHPKCANGAAAQGGEDAPEAGIQPGERVLIEFGRLESGEWYGVIGAADDEDSIAVTSAFPWEVLRALGKLAKHHAEELGAHRLLADPDTVGGCVHASQDGTRCELLQCPSGGAEAVVRMLQEARAAVFSGAPTPLTGEIVRLYGTMKEPKLVAKSEDERILTATFEVSGDDLVPEFGYLAPSAKKQVVAIIYHAHAALARVRADQLDMFGDPNPRGGDSRVSCTETTHTEETAPEATEEAAAQPETEQGPASEEAAGDAGAESAAEGEAAQEAA